MKDTKYISSLFNMTNHNWHITYYSPDKPTNDKEVLTPDVEWWDDGSNKDIEVIGIYFDDQCACLHARLPVRIDDNFTNYLTTQKNSTRPLHITLGHRESMKPVEVGVRLEQFLNNNKEFGINQQYQHLTIPIKVRARIKLAEVGESKDES